MLCRSRRVSSALVSRPVVDALGTATADLRGSAIADFGVRGWVAVLRGSRPDVEEDDPILEFCADAMQTKAATATNKKAILHRIIGNLRFPLSLNYNTFSFKGLPEGNPKKLHAGGPESAAADQTESRMVEQAGSLDGRN